MYRTSSGGRTRGRADGRAGIGARSDCHAAHRRAHLPAENPVYDCHRHTQHAAGGARVGRDGVLLAGQARRERSHEQNFHRADAETDRRLRDRAIRIVQPAERHGRHFQEELEQLKTRLLEMGGLAEEQVRLSIKALVDRDRDLIESVAQSDEPINRLHIEIDNRCFTLLALHQPMAVDLRAIVSAVKINTDLERVGDLAINIAEAVVRYMQHPPVKKLIDIPRMATIAQSMLRDALDAFVRRDTDLAQRVLNEDDKLDALKTLVFRELMTHMLQEPATI